MRGIIQFVDKAPAPPLLPIFRSRQQADLLTFLLTQPEREISVTELSRRLGIPYPSAHREVERAQATGLIRSQRIGNTRLVKADVDSPYHRPLADLLERAFGVPWVLAAALAPVDGITEAHVFGSWAAAHAGAVPERPVADLNLLVLGDPDRDALYAAVSTAEERLGRPIEVTIRPATWLADGDGTFHATVTSRPLVPVPRYTTSTG